MKNRQAHPFSLTADIMLGQTIFGHYEITEHLKDTNYCDIYFAKDREKLKKDLRVVKRLKQPPSPPLTFQQAQDGLKAEAQILDDSKHDQIPQLFTIGEDNYEFYLVQDYIAILRTVFKQPEYHKTRLREG
jgi:serine/threonine protein kinase